MPILRNEQLRERVAELEFFRERDAKTVKAHFEENDSLRARLSQAAAALIEIAASLNDPPNIEAAIVYARQVARAAYAETGKQK